jgi:hypothetical protein
VKKITITNKPSFAFSFITYLLAIPCVILLWLFLTFTNTNNFVKTIAPISRNPNVQKYISETAANRIINNVTLTDLTTALSGNSEFSAINPQWIKIIVQPVIENGVNQIISSNQFYDVFVKSLTFVHKTTLKELNVHTSGLSLNFHPLVISAVTALNNTSISKVTNSLNVTPSTGIIKFNTSKLDKLRQNYQHSVFIAKVVIILPIVTFIISIILSKRRIRTFSNTYIYSSILLFIFIVALLFAPYFVNTANLDQTAAIRSVISNITHSLIMDTTALAVVLLVAGIGIRRYEKQIGSLLSSLYLKLNKTK